ncbi:hypothetical protein BCV72DRAFT_307851 [Rhizopus microsporus var. microsporus]|uniref:Uncharacterized protein n=2 Tax=Rhizopus microsporus TaxID=58291 RepID=A0A2G4SPI4_RHIZD|nr:uncharacterized protein RHIMIDRAFT_239495 [Rhizopus microsporus ATCC 52813]ORE03852.1 hypothetical protein BCV72DRAFT_307851 [Rhizopus microsporus var. microsporus]PHZ10673.1 hypothetical protein RHIMIDRAFT_239495 [Rhizopus microsporus ATCC 52813]
MNNNTVAAPTTNCSSCRAPLPVDSAYRTCQACREQVAATRRRRRAKQKEQEGSPVRRRERPRVEPSQIISAAYTLQLSRLRPLDLGLQLQCLPDPPEYLKDLLERTDAQGRYFKDNLRQYNVAFAFTSLGCDIIYGALCHCQDPLIPIKGNASSYAQLYIYDPSKLLNPLSQCNSFARIYRHAYEILSNHEGSSINSEDIANNNDSAESGSPFIIVSSSMRMRLIEEGDRRTYNLPTMEEVAAAIPIEYIDKSFHDIVLTLESSIRNDSLR